MKLKNNIHIFFLLIFFSSAAHAQDPSFSQFFASPLTLNPALTGNFNGDLRVAGNYRNQWPSVNNAYITSTVSLDMPLMQERLLEGNRWAIGLMAMNDKTANGILNSNYLSFSTAYHKAVDVDGLHKISVGFQGSYVNKKLDGPRLHFLDGLQVDGTWLPSSSEPDNLKVVTSHYFDVNAGALYNGSLNGTNEVYAGIALYHIARPKETFLNNNNIVVPTRVTIHAGGFFPSANAGTTWYVSAVYNRQATGNELVLGTALEICAGADNNKPVNFYVGAWTRLNNVADAAIPYIGLDYGSFNLGMTYDVNISGFKKASYGMGGIEISLIYIMKKKDHTSEHEVQCPRF
ncbi:MAG: PorP/SprF family type IX secretion system membrane protein [Bacteroidetes bacterium]|nr:PorP/SprF family type IX secretion system membrane protein [Bacteroidota bacterium]